MADGVFLTTVLVVWCPSCWVGLELDDTSVFFPGVIFLEDGDVFLAGGLWDGRVGDLAVFFTGCLLFCFFLGGGDGVLDTLDGDIVDG